MGCAFDRKTHCAALTDRDCPGCCFFKTPEQLDEGRERAIDRIYKLPEEQQDHIRQKYKNEYRSSMDE